LGLGVCKVWVTFLLTNGQAIQQQQQLPARQPPPQALQQLGSNDMIAAAARRAQETNLQLLAEMGFSDAFENNQVLSKFSNDLHQALDELSRRQQVPLPLTPHPKPKPEPLPAGAPAHHHKP